MTTTNRVMKQMTLSLMTRTWWMMPQTMMMRMFHPLIEKIMSEAELCRNSKTTRRMAIKKCLHLQLPKTGQQTQLNSKLLNREAWLRTVAAWAATYCKILLNQVKQGMTVIHRTELWPKCSPGKTVRSQGQYTNHIQRLSSWSSLKPWANPIQWPVFNSLTRDTVSRTCPELGTKHWWSRVASRLRTLQTVS